MAGMINSLEAAVLDHVLNKSAYTPPISWYVGLATDATTPTETGTNFTEVSGGAYARQQVTTSGWNAASGGDPSVIDNNGAIQFATVPLGGVQEGGHRQAAARPGVHPGRAGAVPLL